MKIYLIVLFILLRWNCLGQCNNRSIDDKLIEERRNLKNYAFCQCLRHELKSDSLFIKDGSSSGYFEIGAYDIKVYEMIDSITKYINSNKYKSYGGKTLGIMKCLDFYNGKELENIINNFDKYIIMQRLEKK